MIENQKIHKLPVYDYILWRLKYSENGLVQNDFYSGRRKPVNFIVELQALVDDDKIHRSKNGRYTLNKAFKHAIY